MNERIQALIIHITERLPQCEIGELLFMHHVILETMDMIAEDKEQDVYKYCAGLEQSIYNEVSLRISRGDLNLADPQDLYSRLKEHYEYAGDSAISREIKESMIKFRKKRGSKAALKQFEERIMKQGIDFFERYKQELGIKEPRLRPKYRIPTPSEIINGKTPPDVPNT